jgi:hypothetical protein
MNPRFYFYILGGGILNNEDTDSSASMRYAFAAYAEAVILCTLTIKDILRNYVLLK